MPMHGTLAAFDTRGGMLWSESIEDQNLIVDQLSHLPVLLMASQRSEREANVTSQKITVEVLDKQTGKHLLEESRYVTGSSVRVLEVDPARQMIDLNTSRERLRLQIDPK